MELEVKHLAPYLPYGLKLQYVVREKVEKTGIMKTIIHNEDETHPTKVSIDWNDSEHIWMFKPILRPLSDLDKELFINGWFGFVPAKRLANEYLITSYWGTNEIGTGILDKDGKMVNLCFIANEILGECPFMIYQSLCEWHFDIFNLIGQGLAVDINTLSVE
jgi:hypothetical protein